MVSRETAAAELFGDRLADAHRYAELLATDGIAWGLLGPREAERVWDRHLLNSAALATLLARGSRVVDVGSGAGLPGIPLALARPDLRITLLEPLLRRTRFLEEVVARVGLPNVAVRRGRAEEAAPDDADVAVSRAVAPMEKLARWCLPLVRPGGEMLAIKGERAATELAAAAPALGAMGASNWSLELVGAELLAEPVRVVRVVRRG